ncbi:hypothetical protein, partial [Mesorhizobium sp. M0968]|uniref:hypothetical protein n=1 Tax=Mesorhizobium sp. M0968 TaxID=2957037 RepID=UPI00333D0A0B
EEVASTLIKTLRCEWIHGFIADFFNTFGQNLRIVDDRFAPNVGHSAGPCLPSEADFPGVNTTGEVAPASDPLDSFHLAADTTAATPA